MKNTNNTLRVITDSVVDTLPDGFDKEGLIHLLMQAAAEEVQAWYQYILPAKFAVGFERAAVVEQFVKIAHDEVDDHFEALLERLSQLEADVTPLANLWNLQAVSDAYITPEEPFRVESLLEKAIASEEKAIQTYSALLAYTKDLDPVTFHLARRIMEEEEEHLTTFRDFEADIKAYGN